MRSASDILRETRESTIPKFDALYREHASFVWASAYRLGVAEHALDDVVQEVFATAFRRLDELHFEVSLRGWLFGVTRRVAHRHRRSLARKLRRERALAEATDAATSPQQRQDAAHDLERYLGMLSDPVREVFVMSELLGLSGPEIAAELGIPLNTTYSRLRIGRRQLERVARERMAEAITGSRAKQRPSSGALRRNRAAVLAAVQSPWTWFSTKVFAARWLLGPLFLAGPFIAGVASGTPSVPSRSIEAPEHVAPPVVRQSSVPTPVRPQQVSEPSPSSVVAQAPPSPVRRSSRARARVVESPVVDAGPGPGRGLQEETRLVAQARSLLRGNDAVAALGVVQEHRRRFRFGQLARVRDEVEIEVLCALGRSGHVRRAEATYRERYPNSVRSEVGCRVTDPDDGGEFKDDEAP